MRKLILLSLAVLPLFAQTAGVWTQKRSSLPLGTQLTGTYTPLFASPARTFDGQESLFWNPVDNCVAMFTYETNNSTGEWGNSMFCYDPSADDGVSTSGAGVGWKLMWSSLNTGNNANSGLQGGVQIQSLTCSAGVVTVVAPSQSAKMIRLAGVTRSNMSTLDTYTSWLMPYGGFTATSDGLPIITTNKMFQVSAVNSAPSGPYSNNYTSWSWNDSGCRNGTWSTANASLGASNIAIADEFPDMPQRRHFEGGAYDTNRNRIWLSSGVADVNAGPTSINMTHSGTADLYYASKTSGNWAWTQVAGFGNSPSVVGSGTPAASPGPGSTAGQQFKSAAGPFSLDVDGLPCLDMTPSSAGGAIGATSSGGGVTSCGMKFPYAGFDPTNDVFVIFGGLQANNICATYMYYPATNTWKHPYDGTNACGTIAPPANQNTASGRLVNIGGGYLLLYGGNVNSGGFSCGPGDTLNRCSGDTWVYKTCASSNMAGCGWTKVLSTNNPPPDSSPVVDFATHLGAVVLIDHQQPNAHTWFLYPNYSTSPSTWQWVDQNYTGGPTLTYSQTNGSAMGYNTFGAYDPLHKQMVVWDTCFANSLPSICSSTAARIWTLSLASPNNTMTATNKGVTTTNYPLQFGRVFNVAEFPTGTSPQVTLDGTPVPTQVDVKQRYPDGSLKHAIFSLLIPNFAANQTVNITFIAGTVTSNTALTQAQMLNSAYNFDAHMSLTSSGVTKTASARQMLTDGKYTTWTSGPIATTILLGDHSQGTTCGGKAASAYDFGFDTFCPVRPLFDATFWPTINKVKVRYIGEIANTEQAEDVVITDMTMTIGNTSPSTVYIIPSAKLPLSITFGSRWTKTFWLGGTPGAVNLNHNLAYLASTKAVPNYDTTKVVPDAALVTAYSTWNTSRPHNIFDCAEWTEGTTPCNITAGGAHAYLGPLASWTVRWLYTGDYRPFEQMNGNVDMFASFPIHFREGDAARMMDIAGAVPALGHPISISSRPLFSLQGSANGFIGGGAANGSAIASVGPTAYSTYNAGGAGNYVINGSHHPSFSAEYLLTGDHFIWEEAAFLSSWSASWYSDCSNAAGRGRGPTCKEGHIPMKANIQGYQLRGQGWTLLDRAYTAWIAPDGAPEKAYQDTLTKNVIASLEGIMNIQTTPNHGNAMWNWGFAAGYTLSSVSDRYWSAYDGGAYVGMSPLHFWDLGNNQLCPGLTENNGIMDRASVGECTTMWMQDYVVLALGRARELGYPTDALLAWVAPNYTGQILDTGYNPYLAGAYRTVTTNPTKTANAQSWAEVKSYFQPTAQNETGWYPGTGQSASPGNEFNAGGNVQPFMAVSSYVADQPNGGALWQWVYTNIMPAIADDGTSDRGTRWAILPRSVNGSIVPVAPTITTVSLPNATSGAAYSQTLAALGDAPITWSITAGALPLGLSLSSGGVISGTTTAAGTASFTVRATNNTGSDSKALSITIASPVITTTVRGLFTGVVR